MPFELARAKKKKKKKLNIIKTPEKEIEVNVTLCVCVCVVVKISRVPLYRVGRPAAAVAKSTNIYRPSPFNKVAILYTYIDIYVRGDVCVCVCCCKSNDLLPVSNPHVVQLRRYHTHTLANDDETNGPINNLLSLWISAYYYTRLRVYSLCYI